MENMTESDQAEPEKLKVLRNIASQRSISLCGAMDSVHVHDTAAQHRVSSSPGQGGAGRAWNKLGLYLKGLPPKALRKGQKQPKFSEGIAASTNKELFALKTDQATLDTRLTVQERRYNIAMASMEMEMKTTWQAVESLREDNYQVGQYMEAYLEGVQEKIGKMKKRSYDYGKLKYEEKVHRILEAFDLYAISLHHGKESIGIEIKDLLENINDEKLLEEIQSIQEEVEFNADEKEDNFSNYFDSELQKLKDPRKPERDLKRKSRVSLVVQELKQRKVSSNVANTSRMVSVEPGVIPEESAEINSTLDTVQTMKEVMDNTIDTLADVDGWELLNCIRYIVAAGLILTAVGIMLATLF